jgi:hypothetical protein
MSDEKRPDASPPRPGDLTAGARVRVTSGAFTGKGGVVAEADGKGVLVVLGQITVRVSLDEVELVPAAARDRPVLPTSHVGRRAGKKVR